MWKLCAVWQGPTSFLLPFFSLLPSSLTPPPILQFFFLYLKILLRASARYILLEGGRRIREERNERKARWK